MVSLYGPDGPFTFCLLFFFGYKIRAGALELMVSREIFIHVRAGGQGKDKISCGLSSPFPCFHLPPPPWPSACYHFLDVENL